MRKQYTFRGRSWPGWRTTEAYHEETEGSVADFCRLRGLKTSFCKNLSLSLSGWRHPEARANLVSAMAGDLKKANRVGHRKPRYPKAQAVLHREAKEKRAKGRKVRKFKPAQRNPFMCASSTVVHCNSNAPLHADFACPQKP